MVRTGFPERCVPTHGLPRSLGPPAAHSHFGHEPRQTLTVVIPNSPSDHSNISAVSDSGSDASSLSSNSFSCLLVCLVISYRKPDVSF